MPHAPASPDSGQGRAASSRALLLSGGGKREERPIWVFWSLPDHLQLHSGLCRVLFCLVLNISKGCDSLAVALPHCDDTGTGCVGVTPLSYPSPLAGDTWAG